MSRLANGAVEVLLRSPAHPLLSSKVQLIRYRGRRTGQEHTTPTQYVELDSARVAIVVGRPETKRWWRNFREPRPLYLLIRGVWRHSRARTCWRHEEPEQVDEAIGAFAAKYGPRHTAIPGGEDDVLIVFCDLVAEDDE